MAPGEIDRLYDAGKAVTDSAAKIACWSSESAKARTRLPLSTDIPYGPSEVERLDVFFGRHGGPVHLFIHGGYWRRFSAKDFSFLAGPLVEAGTTVIIPDYALCPEVGIGEIVRQMRSALRWVIEHRAMHGGDPGSLTISGHSAGGHLVGMMLATDWSLWRDMPTAPIKGAIAVSGIYDLAPLAYSWLQPVLQLDHHQIERLSPIRQVRKHDAPLLLAVGGEESDAFHSQADRYTEAWTSAGNSVSRTTLAGRDHFTVLDELPELANRLTPR